MKPIIITILIVLTLNSCMVQQITLYTQKIFVVTEIDKAFATCTSGDMTVLIRHDNKIKLNDSLVSLIPYTSFVIKRGKKAQD